MKPNEQHFYAYLVFLIIGLLTSIPFTTNIGKFYGDIIYHYVWNYLVTIISIFNYKNRSINGMHFSRMGL
jgi:hypothetical protein